MVSFKSTINFYEKEKKGIKNNTVRFEDNSERFNKLKAFEKGEIKNLKIKIELKDKDESFIRQIQDVSIYENIFIITWQV